MPRSTWASRYAWIVGELEGGNRSEVARKLGVTPQAIANIVQSGTVPSGDTLAETLRAYPSLSAEWLLTGTGPRERSKGRDAERTLEEIEAIVRRTRAKGR